eukprot:scaffold7203_cov416-Prasinococcus_capsulatus_cf.AAC.12
MLRRARRALLAAVFQLLLATAPLSLGTNDARARRGSSGDPQDNSKGAGLGLDGRDEGGVYDYYYTNEDSVEVTELELELESTDLDRLQRAMSGDAQAFQELLSEAMAKKKLEQAGRGQDSKPGNKQMEPASQQISHKEATGGRGKGYMQAQGVPQGKKPARTHFYFSEDDGRFQSVQAQPEGRPESAVGSTTREPSYGDKKSLLMDEIVERGEEKGVANELTPVDVDGGGYPDEGKGPAGDADEETHEEDHLAVSIDGAETVEELEVVDVLTRLMRELGDAMELEGHADDAQPRDLQGVTQTEEQEGDVNQFVDRNAWEGLIDSSALKDLKANGGVIDLTSGVGGNGIKDILDALTQAVGAPQEESLCANEHKECVSWARMGECIANPK